MQTSRKFVGQSSRYAYDTGKCAARLGWAQAITESDASYYGTWVNPSALMIVTYAEGDETAIMCADAAEFVAGLERFRDWHRGNGGYFHIDCLCSPTIYGALTLIPGALEFLPSDHEREMYASGEAFA